MKTVYAALFALLGKVERNYTKTIVFPMILLYSYKIAYN